MSPRFLHPSGRVGVGDEVEEPAKQRQAVPAPEPETGGVRREGIGERAWRSVAWSGAEEVVVNVLLALVAEERDDVPQARVPRS